MFGLTHAEHGRIIEAVHAVLACSKKDKVFVSFDDLCSYIGCGKNTEARNMLISEIRDMLGAHTTVTLFGYWLLSEFGDDGVYVFTQITKPGESLKIAFLTADDGRAAAYSFHPSWPNPRGKSATAGLPNIYFAPQEKSEAQ